MSAGRVVGVVAGLAIIVVAAFYFVRNPERSTLDDASRIGATGKFIRLSDGVTHYELVGADSAQTIVLVHGFSVPYYIWDSTATALQSAGYRVLRYDKFGRGLSDRPSAVYNADFYDRQLSELLDSLRIAGRVDVAGVSMGGWVGATFAGRHPERVRSLILVDPVAGTVAQSLGMFDWPLLGSYLWQSLAVPTMADNQASDFVRPSQFPDWADKYRPQMRYRGFGRALLSTRQAVAGMNMDSVYEVVGRQNTPVLLVWGRADSTVLFERSVGVRKAVPAAEFHPIDSAGHLPILERAALTDSIFLSFLAKRPR